MKMRARLPIGPIYATQLICQCASCICKTRRRFATCLQTHALQLFCGAAVAAARTDQSLHRAAAFTEAPRSCRQHTLLTVTAACQTPPASCDGAGLKRCGGAGGGAGGSRGARARWVSVAPALPDALRPVTFHLCLPCEPLPLHPDTLDATLPLAACSRQAAAPGRGRGPAAARGRGGGARLG